MIARTVTFIGGPADRTRRALPELCTRIRLPVLTNSFATFDPHGEGPEPKLFTEAVYAIRRVSEDHYVAVYEGTR